MGCSVSCALFEQFSSFLEWVVRDVAGVDSVIHYLDDFLCIGPAGSKVCAVLLATLEHIAERFGVPLAPDKTEGPRSVIQFLGIVIDSEAMECRLPADKLEGLKEEVRGMIGMRKVQLRALQSLLGKLNFACRILPMGRIFCRRLAASTAGVRLPNHYVRLVKEHREDLWVWHSFLEAFNGRALWMSGPVSNFDLELYTDAAGGSGFGAFFQGQWSAGPWPQSWLSAGFTKNLVLLELFPVVLAVELWGTSFRDRKVRFHGDNLGVVQVINRVTASSPPVIRLLRHLVLRCLQLNVFVYAVHLPGVENVVADALSRFQWDRFRELVPEAGERGVPCPEWLWQIPLESSPPGLKNRYWTFVGLDFGPLLRGSGGKTGGGAPVRSATGDLETGGEGTVVGGPRDVMEQSCAGGTQMGTFGQTSGGASDSCWG
ncbi:uncharacterized protein LOC120942272 [Rana temporaria]|uniref:uncharacterized protein LOC120942272 n=1 Tax=Rana temporaria TaxID=8407 RepID=UPI001AACF560|nr:uncharacterized protein LOC120942272 [Rana temporaria]